MKKQVFILNGSGGTGKDTFVDLVSIVSGLKATQCSSVDKVKTIAREIGWDGTKNEKARKFLSDLKILCTDFCDMPFKNLVTEYEYFQSEYNHEILFMHIREPDEIARAACVFGAKTILIKRDSTPRINSNPADANVENYKYDITIYNNGDISGLRDKAVRFYADFQQGALASAY